MNKFEKIYLDIESKIKSGEYRVGQLIPSEHELAAHYQVSRETIRKAQKILLEKGFLQKKQGRGSIVLDFNRLSYPVSGILGYKELQADQGIKSDTQVIINDLIDTPDFLVGKHDIRPDEKFIHLVRTRAIEGEVMIVDVDYVRCKFVPNIPHTKALDSIYAYFEDDLGLEISFAHKHGVAEKPDEMTLDLMKLSPLDYVINVTSEIFLEDTSFFLFTTSYYRLEKFSFSEFARREKKVKKPE